MFFAGRLLGRSLQTRSNYSNCLRLKNGEAKWPVNQLVVHLCHQHHTAKSDEVSLQV
jgi:hypothetical protein